MSESRVIKYSIMNMVGLGVPMIAAVFTIPILIHSLGTARFGILTLVWAVVSYFGLFDFGLGRALTLHLTTANATGRNSEAPYIIGTTCMVLALLGVISGLLMWAVATPGVAALRDVSDKGEVIRAVTWMAVAMPAVTLTSGYRGILESLERFDLINYVRVPMGLFTFVGPVIPIALGYPLLDVIAFTLTLGRVIACFAHYVIVRRLYKSDANWLRLSFSLIPQLLTSGGWMTVSNIVSPVMGYIDRFVVGATVGAAAVAFIVTPQEIITKLWIIPIAVTAALFPTMVAQFATKSDQARLSFSNGVFAIYIMVLLPSACLAIFAPEILTIWISPQFSDQSSVPMRVYALGTLINCLAHVPFTSLQSAGRARTTALVHLIELPVYVISVYALATGFGATGAAVAWAARMIFDTSAMFFLCFLANGWRLKWQSLMAVLALAVLCAATFGVALVGPLAIRIGLFILLSGVIVIVGYYWWFRHTPAALHSDAVSV